MVSKKDRGRRNASPDEYGSDPSTFFGPQHDARSQRKVQQLCREVERTLSYALASCQDEWVRDLIVISVEPAPDGSRMMVTLCPSADRLNMDVAQLLERLAGVRGYLRQEVAAAIQRKRTPELAFRVVPPAAPEVTS